jgi:hypothetical protein
MRDPQIAADRFIRDRVVSKETILLKIIDPSTKGASSGGAFRLSADRKLLISFAPLDSDLSRFDTLCLNARNLSGEIVLVGVKLVHGSSDTSESVSLSGGREALAPGDSQRLRFPIESFGLYGTAENWQDIRRIEFTLAWEKDYSGTEPVDVEFYGMDGESRQIPLGPRLTTEGLAEVLFPNGLEKPVNEKALSVYHESNSAIFIPPPHLYPKEPADEILVGKIMGQRVGMPVDWRSNPLGSLEWTHFLHRHHFLRPLVIAATETGEAKYGEALASIITGWITANPVPVDSNGGAGPSWETLSVAWRLREWLWVAGALSNREIPGETFLHKKVSPGPPSKNSLSCSQVGFTSSEAGLRSAYKVSGEGCGEDLFTKRSSPHSSAFPPLLLRSIWEHARNLMDHQGHPNNWIIVESATLALAGLCFTGFRESSQWVETGIQRLEREFKRQFFTDGVHFEISPLYHAICFHALLEVKEVTEAAGLKLPEIFDTSLERCADYLQALCRPNFTWPSLNDSSSSDMDYTALMLKAGEVFGRRELTWIGSKGRNGEHPDANSLSNREIAGESCLCQKAPHVPSPEDCISCSQLGFTNGEAELRSAYKVFGEGCGEDLFTKTSSPGSLGSNANLHQSGLRVFPDAGIATMRSGWESDANFLVFRAGPPGATHVHEDTLSLDVTSLGAPCLVDPGITTYGPDALTDHYRMAVAHNTIVIDGEGPGRSTMAFADRIRPAGTDFSQQVGDGFVAVMGVRRGAAPVGAGLKPSPTWLRKIPPNPPLLKGRERGDFLPEGRGVDKTLDKLEGESCKEEFSVTRTLVFVESRYWVIRDFVSGHGEHKISVCWQFAPGRYEPDPESLTVRYGDPRGSGLALIPSFGGLRPTLRCATGSLKPVSGWVSVQGSDVPAPFCEYRVKAHLPVTMLWLLWPCTGISHPPAVRRRDVKENAVTLDVYFADGSRHSLELAPDAGICLHRIFPRR